MDCSILIPNFNGRAVLNACLTACYEQLTDRPIEREVIVIDNGSSDDSLAFLQHEFSGVVVHRLPRNTGFTGAIQAGASIARGQVLVLLNNDTRPDALWLQELLEPLRDPAIACAGSLMLTADESGTDFAGGTANLFGWGFQQGHNTPAPPIEQPAEQVPQLFVCGGAMAVKRAVWDQLGGFDPDYFAFFEDVDFGWRLHLAGHKAVLATASRVAHQQSHTAKQMPQTLRAFLLERNALATMIKNLSDANLQQLLPWGLALSLERALVDLDLDRDRFFAGRWGDAVFNRTPAGLAGALQDSLERLESGGKRLIRETTGGEGKRSERGEARLLALEAILSRWSYWMEKRRAVQATRAAGDRQLFVLFRDLLRPPLGHPREQALLDELGALLRGSE